MLQVIRASTGLLITPRMIENAKDNKAIGILTMDPYDFLDLTIDTSARQWIASEQGNTRTLDEYNEYARMGRSGLMPFLYVRTDTNKVIEHEGRHRAIALLNAHVRTMPVAITLSIEGVLRYYVYEPTETNPFKKRYLSSRDLPNNFRGQFKPSSVGVNKRSFEEFYSE